MTDMHAISQRYLNKKRALFDKYYEHLNDMQRQAVYTVNGPLLILAGAGSGKTTVLVNRIAYIIRYGNAVLSTYVPENVTEQTLTEMDQAMALPKEELADFLTRFAVTPPPAWSMLAITFTNKAAGELKDRLALMLGEEGTQVVAGTFHSFCARILRTDGMALGYSAHFTIYDTDDSRRLMKECMKTLNIEEKVLSVKTILGEISRAKDRLMDPDDYADEAGADYRLSRVARVYAAYQDELRRSGAMDFDDIIFYTVRLLRENGDILRYYQRKFRYVCIDEYQDTNRAQFVLASLLSGGAHNLMVVGDDDQSIYKFRGATIENILGFDKTFQNATLIKLEQNYRSTKTILDAANGVIGHNVGRKGKSLWTAGDTGEKIILRKCEDQMGESRSIVDTIRRMTETGGYHYRDGYLLNMGYGFSTSDTSFLKSFD